MARQGHRVWLTRLVVIALASLVVVGVIAKILWDKASKGTTVAAVPESVVASHNPDVAHALDPLLAYAKLALEHHRANHQDFSAIMAKQEQVGGKLEPESKMELKLMYRPRDKTENETTEDVDYSSAGRDRLVSVYLKGVEPKSQAGREVIWIEGKNGNKMKAHEAGFLGLIPVDLDPTSAIAMIGNRYPITEIGMEKLLRKLIERGGRDRNLGPATVRTSKDVLLGQTKCTLYEIIHEEKKGTLDGKEFEYEFQLAKVYIDEENQLPICYACYGWPKKEGGEPELLEKYTYENLKLNVGLTDEDFNPKNPNYHF